MRGSTGDASAGSNRCRPPHRLPLQQRRRIYVGEVVASATPLLLQTLLGSCVAVCLWDPVACIGGMNHILLPGRGDGDDRPSRYGVHAMELLINAIMNQGGDRRKLVAKAFGARECACQSSITDHRGTECCLCPQVPGHREDSACCPTPGRHSPGAGQFQDGYRQDYRSHRRRFPLAFDSECGGRLSQQPRQDRFRRTGRSILKATGDDTDASPYKCLAVK